MESSKSLLPQNLQTIKQSYIIVPIINAEAEPQTTFNDSITNSSTPSNDSWFTDRKLTITGLEFQVAIGTSQNVLLPKGSIAAQRTAGKIVVPNKKTKLQFSITLL